MDERNRWNARYDRAVEPDDPPPALVALLPHLPTSGRALDLAGGRGGAARLLARNGLDVTLVEVSDVAIAKASSLADAERLDVSTQLLDLENDPFPRGPWDLITCFRYLHRPMFADAVAELAPGGTLAVGVATAANLERHPRPSRRFLLEPDEILDLVRPLVVEFHAEAWTPDGHHEARLVARKPMV